MREPRNAMARCAAVALLVAAPLLMAPAATPPSQPGNRAPLEPNLGGFAATDEGVSGEITPCLDLESGGPCDQRVAAFGLGADILADAPLRAVGADAGASGPDWAISGLEPNTYYQLVAYATDGDATVYAGPFVVATSDAVPTPPAPAYPGVVPAGQHAGFLDGAFSVTPDGSARYEIPIAVPPGTAGLAPELSIAYDSRRGNGSLGMGFALEGLSEIARCLPNPLQDGHVDPIDFDANDVFCLDGEPLVAIAGSYGASGTEYRTRSESFAKVISQGGSGTDPAWFEVRTRDGRLLEYGRTADARVEVPGRSEARLWAVNRVSDRFGNYLSVTYDEEPDLGNHWPLRIDYTGNDGSGTAPYAQVAFSYNDPATSPRPDPILGFFAGDPLDDPRRLTHVRSYAPDAAGTGLELVFDYSLVYEDELAPGASTSGRSRLAELRQCDADAVCLPPTRFAWSDAPGTTSPLDGGGSPAAAVDIPDPSQDLPPGVADVWDLGQDFAQPSFAFPAELNGDGLTDVVRVEFDEPEFTGSPCYRVRFATAISKGDGSFLYNGTSTDTWSCSRFRESANPYLPGDFDGDGLTDIFHVRVKDLDFGRIEIVIWRAVGDGRFAQLPTFVTQWQVFYSLAEKSWYTFAVGDANGDGRDDLLGVTPEVPWCDATPGADPANSRTNILLHVAYSNGDGSFDDRPEQWTPWKAWGNEPGCSTFEYEDGPFDLGRWQVVDANGDGLLDLVGLAGWPEMDGIYTAFSTGDGFDVLPAPHPFPMLAGAPMRWGWGEDSICFGMQGTVCHNELEHSYWVPLDLNGDGNTDFLFVSRFDPNTNQPVDAQFFWTALSRGDGSYEDFQLTRGDDPAIGVPYFDAKGYYLSGYGHLGGNFQWSSARIRVHDLDGDGLDDVTILRGAQFGASFSRHDLYSNPDGTFERARRILEGYWGETMCGTPLVPIMDIHVGGEDEFQGDVNGDGKLDWICFKESKDKVPAWPPQIHTLFADGNADPDVTEKSDLLVEIRNGAEDASLQPLVTAIAYQTLAAPPPAPGEPDERVYVPSAIATSYPLTEVIDGRSVVAAYEVDDGIGGVRRSEHFYVGERRHLTLRQSLGFESVEATDTTAGVVETVAYSQSVPLQRLPVLEERRTTGGQLLARTERAWVAAQLEPGARTTQREDGRVTWEWEPSDPNPGASAVRTRARDFAYDAYDNVVLDASYWGEGEIAAPAGGDWASLATGLFQEVVASTYHPADETSWLIGRLASQTTTAQLPSGGPADAITRSVELPSYWQTAAGGTLAPARRIDEPTPAPDEPWTHRVTDWAYDAFGNVVSETVSDSESGPVLSRTLTTGFDVRGRFPIWQERVSAPGVVHRTDFTYEPRHGRLVLRTDPIGVNGLTRTWAYDGLGREILEERPDGTETITYYSRCDATCRPEAAHAAGELSPYVVTARASGAPPVSRYHDAFGRVFLEETLGLNGGGTPVLVATGHDALGRPVRKSRPYYEDAAEGPQFTTSEYDVLDRVTRVVTPDATPEVGATRYAYNGLVTAVTNPLNHTSVTLQNARGWIVEVTDATGQKLLYAHDAFGHATRAWWAGAAAQTQVVTRYDRAGRKKTLDDPDMGRFAGAPPWTWTYNVFGEIAGVVDPNLTSTTLSYDGLGRMTARVQMAGATELTTWIYDNAAAGLGLLARNDSYVNGALRARRTFSYDSLGRPAHQIDEVAGQYFVTSTTYDAYGRVDLLAYPSDREVRHVYDALGFLREVRRGDNTLLWQLQMAEPDGRPRYVMLGNSVYDRKVYDPRTGRLSALEVWRHKAGQGFTTYQQLELAFDFVGNLTSRQDHLNEPDATSFGYDALDRLKEVRVGGSLVNAYAYDALGNLTSKSGVGSYDYGLTTGGAGPHAVTRLVTEGPASETRHYRYDWDGNLTCRGASAPAPAACDGTEIVYTPFGKPSRISEPGGAESQLLYGVDQRRVRQIATGSGGTTSTTYVGQHYEQVTGGDGSTKHVHHVFAGGVAVAQLIDTEVAGTTTPQTRFLHRDHLGSVRLITKYGSSGLAQRLDFDPHGSRSVAEGPAEPELTRGFTGHEHLDGVGIIHMNGRVYDPELGRMLSPDPIVQAPLNLQNFNRYSYVMNNPLSYTDPSGYAGKGFSYEVTTFRSLGYDENGVEHLSLKISTHTIGGEPDGGGSGGGLAPGGSARQAIAAQRSRSLSRARTPVARSPLGSRRPSLHTRGSAQATGADPAQPPRPIGRFLGAIGVGLRDLGGVLAEDLGATFTGLLGNAYGLGSGLLTTLAGVASLNPQAIGEGLSELRWALVPRYGFFAGPGWGRPSGLGYAPFDNPIDRAAFVHDRIATQPGADRRLVRDVWSGHAVGPYGQLYRIGLTIGFGAGIALGLDD